MKNASKINIDLDLEFAKARCSIELIGAMKVIAARKA